MLRWSTQRKLSMDPWLSHSDSGASGFVARSSSLADSFSQGAGGFAGDHREMIGGSLIASSPARFSGATSNGEVETTRWFLSATIGSTRVAGAIGQVSDLAEQESGGSSSRTRMPGESERPLGKERRGHRPSTRSWGSRLTTCEPIPRFYMPYPNMQGRHSRLVRLLTRKASISGLLAFVHRWTACMLSLWEL